MPEKTWPLTVICERLAIQRSTLYSLLSRHAACFGPPRYRRVGRHPRKHRVLTRDEIVIIESLVLVNKNFFRS